MTNQWTTIRGRFDVEATKFSLAVQARWPAEKLGASDNAAWRAYQERQKTFEAAIAGVVAFNPETQEEERAKLNAAGRMMMLCHELEETWLEAEALKINDVEPIIDS